MDQPEVKRPGAWQPLTPRGVAAFATASTDRLFLVQVVFALLVAATVVWFLHRNWFSAVGAAIDQLPAKGQIEAGRLVWNAESPQLLAVNPFLAFSVDLKHEGTMRSPAHLAIEFGEKDWKIFSVFGYAQWNYPQREVWPFNRLELRPKWGAWAPPLLAATGILVVTGLMIMWGILAMFYAVPIWLLAFFGDRELGWRASWRVAGAALMPGSLFITIAIFLYGLNSIGVLELLVAWGMHLVISWVYILWSPHYLARRVEAEAGKENPFTAPTQASITPKPLETEQAAAIKDPPEKPGSTAI